MRTALDSAFPHTTLALLLALCVLLLCTTKTALLNLVLEKH